jgi:hypothetical protein
VFQLKVHVGSFHERFKIKHLKNKSAFNASSCNCEIRVFATIFPNLHVEQFALQYNIILFLKNF